ncbi:MAG: hypothetical protein LBQ43_02450 [Holosporales bacterium]|jgi:N-glycosylase/DNA lyase|nr:hypothetical protein [Holosporales bacterium]
MTTVNIPDFSIEQIANSGQCFRINKSNEVRGTSCAWEVKALGKGLIIQQNPNMTHTFDCPVHDYCNKWTNYFDVNRDYAEIKRRILERKDPYLTRAVEYGWGLRILKQDPWEIIVSFIISQRTSIPRIKTLIEKLCHDKDFPSPEKLDELSEADLSAMGFGYRAKYIRSIVTAVLNGDLNIEFAKRLDTRSFVEYFTRFDGIGPKVAHCIALFGFHKIDAFPRDVWVNRVIDERYSGKFSLEGLEDVAGIVQQYMFFYERYLQKESK